MIEKLNHHYSFTSPASVYDEEALTALELAGRTASKVNEVVKSQNDLETKTEYEISSFKLFIQKEIERQDNHIPVEVAEQIRQNINLGLFDEAISLYLNNLENRVDTLSRAVANGEVSSNTDAELVDIRTTLNGFSQINAGGAVRSLETYIQGLVNKDKSTDISKLIDWQEKKSLSLAGQLVDVSNEKWVVGSIVATKGTTISYDLTATPNSCVVAVGCVDFGQPNSGVVRGKTEGTRVGGVYTVKEDFERIFFMTDKTTMDATHIYIRYPNAVLGQNPLWYMGYIDPVCQLVSDENAKLHAYTARPIEIPALSMMTAQLQCGSSVSAVCLCDKDGNNRVSVELGKNGNERHEYTYINATDKTVYVMLTTRVNKLWDDTTIDTTFFNDTNIQIKPITEKYRVPTFSIGNGHVSVSENNIKNDGVYHYSDMITLFPNETIRFPSAGSNGAWLLSEWERYNRVFVRGLVQGDSKFRWVEYTNTTDKPMTVRTTAKVVSSAATDNAITEAEFTNVKIYAKDIYYQDVKNHPLYGKRIALLGDSLFAGNNTGVDSTWWSLLAHKYNMTPTFIGGNGLTAQNIYTEFMDNYSFDGADYYVVICGANDFRLDVLEMDYKDFLGFIIDAIREKSPKSKLLCMTNMKRFPNNPANAMGYTEKNYVDAMVNVCREKCVRVFNNYTDLGIDLSNQLFKWADEGHIKTLQFEPTTTDNNTNKHLSREGYEWVLPVYENLIMGL